MAISKTIEARPSQGKAPEKFTVNNWPENPAEAVKLWGDEAVMHCINGTSAKVQVQGAYRGFRNLEEDPQTAKQAAESVKDWKGSEGGTRGMSKSEKLKKGVDALSPEERLEYFQSIGISKQDAERLSKS